MSIWSRAEKPADNNRPARIRRTYTYTLYGFTYSYDTVKSKNEMPYYGYGVVPFTYN